MQRFNGNNSVRRHYTVLKYTVPHCLSWPTPSKETMVLYITVLEHSLDALVAQEKYLRKGKCLVLPQSKACRLERKIFPYQEGAFGAHNCHREAASLLQHHLTWLIAKIDPLIYNLNPPTMIGS